nr:phospholipase-like protein [Tanacetum cinerariifolium]
MVTRLSTSLVKRLADEALDAGKKLQMSSSTAKTINILAQVKQILYMVQQSPSRLKAKALDPIIEALIAKELLNHPDIDVNILVACFICDVLRITTPYNHEQMKIIFICCHIQDGENVNHDHGGKAFPHELVRLLVTSVKKDNQIAPPVCS